MIEEILQNDAAKTLAMQLAKATNNGLISAVQSKIELLKNKHELKEVTAGYNELINQLIDSNRELESIAKNYKMLYEQIEITPENLEYLQTTLRTLLNSIDLEDELDPIVNLISIDIIKTLQLLGFNFKKAIGEPLTEICATSIRDWANNQKKDDVQESID